MSFSILECKIIFFEKRILNLQQNQIIYFSISSFSSIFSSRILLMRSFFVHLRIVRDFLHFTNVFSFLDQDLYKDSYFKILISFNFRKYFFSRRLLYSFFSDISESFVFQLYSILLSPLIESYNSNILFLFRPFRRNYDYYLNIKSNFFTNSFLSKWIIRANFRFFFNPSFFNSSFFLNRNFSNTIFCSKLVGFNFSNSLCKFLFYFSDFYYYFFSFILFGLLNDSRKIIFIYLVYYLIFLFSSDLFILSCINLILVFLQFIYQIIFII